jgi:hypothetical protein
MKNIFVDDFAQPLINRLVKLNVTRRAQKIVAKFAAGGRQQKVLQ